MEYRLLGGSGLRQVCEAQIAVGENIIDIAGEGSGPIDAFIAAMISTPE